MLVVVFIIAPIMFRRLNDSRNGRSLIVICIPTELQRQGKEKQGDIFDSPLSLCLSLYFTYFLWQNSNLSHQNEMRAIRLVDFVSAFPVFFDESRSCRPALDDRKMRRHEYLATGGTNCPLRTVPVREY